MTVSDGMQGGGHRGGGDDHDDGSDASSPNDNDNGAEEEKAAVNIVKDKVKKFPMGLTLICWDNATTMMDAPPPLLVHSPLSLLGLPFQQNDRTAGAKKRRHLLPLQPKLALLLAPHPAVAP